MKKKENVYYWTLDDSYHQLKIIVTNEPRHHSHAKYGRTFYKTLQEAIDDQPKIEMINV